MTNQNPLPENKIDVLQINDELNQLKKEKLVLKKENQSNPKTAALTREALELLNGRFRCYFSDYKMPGRIARNS